MKGLPWTRYAARLIVGVSLLLSVVWLFLPHRGRPNVLFVVIDSLRADRLGAYGSTKGLTPFLDSLARESVIYENAYATTSWTIPSVASMFLASYPSEHGVTGFYSRIPKDASTLAEVLRAKRVATAAFTANASIQPAAGFNVGFERFENIGTPTVFKPKSDGKLLNRAVLDWRAKAPRKPFFAYLHFMDVHAPYGIHKGITSPRPKMDGRSDADLNTHIMTAAWEKEEADRIRKWTLTPDENARLQQLYDGEVVYIDRVLAALFRALDRRGDLANTLVIVTADHGEEFGEHGAFSHGASLYQGAIRVPLIVRLADERRGTRIERPVSLAGLGPAILDMLHIAAPPNFHAEPVPFHQQGTPPGSGATAYTELLPSQMRIRMHQHALVTPSAKLLVMPTGELESYDLAADPLEQHRLDKADNELRVALLEVRSRLETGQTAQHTVEIDEATRQRLHDVGYFPDKH